MQRKLIKISVATLIVFLLVLVGIKAFWGGYAYVLRQDERLMALKKAEADGQGLITEDTPGAISVFIPRSANMEDISQILKENGLISNPFLFKVVSKFNGYNGNYQAGTHYLLPGMNYDELMYTLTRRPEPVKITFLEGETYQEMKQKMLDSGLNIDVRRLDELVRHPNEFLNYSFVRELSSNPDREWLLQGYLWPDTYWIDPTFDEVSILRMFLDNTEKKLEENDYRQRAASMNMTLDQVMTIASIVQKEGNISEMSKIGRVFLNRFSQEMPMESCATINYLRGELGESPIPWASAEDLVRFAQNPYNTYSHKGLPPGPINNPGTIAIEGILWPATEDTWAGANSYLFFCATGEGDNVFATTLEQHEANVEYYRKAWESGEKHSKDSETEDSGTSDVQGTPETPDTLVTPGT